MAQAPGAEQVALLQSWLAETAQAGSSSGLHTAHSRVAPPSGLTPEHFSNAGFELYSEHARHRRVAGVRFQVNFSPDRRHQAIFVQRSDHRGSATLLWIDGQEVPVPVDAHGKPASKALMLWLDRRLSQGLIAKVENPARAMSLWAWTAEAGRLVMQGPRSFKHTYPAPPRDLTPEDCDGVGFQLDEHSAQSFLDAAGTSTVRVDFSPDLRHQAVLIKGSGDWSGALMWVDGEAIPVPREADGDPVCEQIAQWIDNRFVYAEIGGLRNHPLSRPKIFDPLGEIRGLLIWDTARHRQQIELPQSNQAWTVPILVTREHDWRIYPNGEAFKQDRPDRVLPIPR